MVGGDAPGAIIDDLWLDDGRGDGGFPSNVDVPRGRSSAARSDFFGELVVYCTFARIIVALRTCWALPDPHCSMGISGEYGMVEAAAIGAAWLLKAFNPSPSREIVCNIAALAVTVRSSAVSSGSSIAIASDTPWLSASRLPIIAASPSVTFTKSNARSASRIPDHPMSPGRRRKRYAHRLAG